MEGVKKEESGEFGGGGGRLRWGEAMEQFEMEGLWHGGEGKGLNACEERLRRSATPKSSRRAGRNPGAKLDDSCEGVCHIAGRAMMERWCIVEVSQGQRYTMTDVGPTLMVVQEAIAVSIRKFVVWTFI